MQEEEVCSTISAGKTSQPWSAITCHPGQDREKGKRGFEGTRAEEVETRGGVNDLEKLKYKYFPNAKPLVCADFRLHPH